MNTPLRYLSLKPANHMAALLCLFVCALPVKAYAQAVGKASLVIGTAFIEALDSSGKKQRLKSGDDIFDEHQISTSTNGHVHIRFNDQGLVSVRPNSRLSIDKYDYNSADPSQSTVKFSLIRGSTRSVSGKAAQSAKQRFRMNTPIAAIGVRGTDFVIRADQKNIQAIVNEGAIVVAPFSDQCSTDTLGPCSTNSVVLHGDSKQLLKFNQLLAAPQLLPATEQQLQDQLLSEPSDDKSTGSKSKKSRDSFLVYNENLAKESLTGTFVSTIIDFTPQSPIASQQESQLAWGRWGSAKATDKIAIDSAIASLNRKPTVGNLDFGLFRKGTDELVAANLGVISFNLSRAQVDYNQSGNASAMLVQGGFLDINFNNKVFHTGLSLQHAATGDVNFSSIGRIDDAGLFVKTTADTHIGGAVSLDGQEAGYHFIKDLPNGTVKGITLWGAQ